MYVEELIGPDTMNTMPQATIQAFKEHGKVNRTVDQRLENARDAVGKLGAAGIDLRLATAQLEKEGIEGFSKSYNALIAGIKEKSTRFRP